jgi:hexosaminidase
MMRRVYIWRCLFITAFLVITLHSEGQQNGRARIAVIQATASPNQDPFMDNYDQSKVRPGMNNHFNKLLGLFEEAGRMGADLVCGPEDMQHIGSYGLYVDVKDTETGEILFNSLAVPVPGPLTAQVAAIARKYGMYIIAPVYEADSGKIFNTAVLFDRQGNIAGKHRKTVLPVMETWLVSTGDKYDVFRTDFATIAVATCWEISYPEISEIYALRGADIIFNPTMAGDNKPGQSLATAPMFTTRARDNSVCIAPVVLGTDGNGIIDFNGDVVAEAVGIKDTVIMAEIDFTKERSDGSKWWKTINGTDNLKAIHYKSRRPETYQTITDPHPPVMAKYKDVNLTTGDRKRQLEAVKEVDYGPRAGAQKQRGTDLNLIPYPRDIRLEGEPFHFAGELTIVLDKNPSPADRFTAEEFISDLRKEWNIEAAIGPAGGKPAVVLTRKSPDKSLNKQGYSLVAGKGEVIIRALGEEGLFYGTRTFLQLIRQNANGYIIPGVKINDRPDILIRAVHYDTKHHQDKASYVKSFIKDLAGYKVNMLVWEWEDKFAYPSHPEIGAPGAFTMQEMQELTRFAQQYHIQIVPLVQGLGHVSYILKWPGYKNLREVESSNWEFCPLKQGSYDLLFDLWKDAVEATPGSEYIHIGSDETYELGSCPDCRARSQVTGRSGLYQLFINRSADFLRTKGRKVMAWETPMGWKTGDSPAKGIVPSKGLILTESYDYETPDFTYIKQAKDLGYKVFAYDPNPGVVPLMVPYDFEKGEGGENRRGSLEKSARFISSAAGTGLFDGMISTSWDDDDLHNQMWMLHFINAAAFAWNGKAPSPEKLKESFLSDYYGRNATDLEELFTILNEAAYYYAGTLERNVWHYGEIGKTHLPDLPRGDALEYDPFWNTRYKQKVNQSEEMLARTERALEIIRKNKNAGVRHAYDLDIFRTTAELVRHTCLTYLDLSKLENTIREAHKNRFVDCRLSVKYLNDARELVEADLKRRETVYNDLVKVYEVTRFPRGLDTGDKKYLWQQDRARHFANRRPDMTFLIYDEQLLDLEGYLGKLEEYIKYFTGVCSEY